MACTRAFLLLDIDGLPLTTATPTFVDYRDKTGANRTPPANPTHIGGGEYAFTPDSTDETVGTVALVDGGATAFPRRHVFPLYEADRTNQFFAWCLEDDGGELWTGTAPTVGLYVSKTGSPLSAPTISSVAGAYLYALTPSASDFGGQVVARLDSPVGANAPYFHAVSLPLRTTVPAVPSTGLNPEGLATRHLLDYLRLYLPRKMVELNSLRAAVMMTPGIGTGTQIGWTITTGMKLAIATSRSGSGTLVTLPVGAAVTASTIATAINAAPVAGITASADDDGRLVLTSTTAPSASGDSVVVVAKDTTGGNAALGFDPGGEHVSTSYISPPTWRSVMDGYPVAAPDAKAGMWVIIGDRDSKPWPGPGPDIRRNETDVAFVLEIFRPEANKAPHRSRDAIQTCVRAVREVLQSVDGRQLGRGQVRDIIRVDVLGVRVGGRPFSFSNRESPNVLCDVAAITINVRVFQRLE